MSKKILSVIIPVHNRHDLFLECVNSVINQKGTRIDFEIIVVDEASNPSIKSFLTKEASSVVKKIKIIRNKRALGPSLARTIGLSVSKGNYVAFLDSDDFWHPLFVSKMAGKVDAGKEIVTCFGKPVFIGSSGFFEKVYFYFQSLTRIFVFFLSWLFNGGKLPPSLLYMIRLSGMIFSRGSIGNSKFVMSYRNAEDWKFVWDCIRKNKAEIIIFPEFLVSFSYHVGSETAGRSHYWGYYYKLIDELTPDLRRSLGIKFFKAYTNFSVWINKSEKHIHYKPKKLNNSGVKFL